MRILDTIAGVKIYEHTSLLIAARSIQVVSFVSLLRIDNDGSGGNPDKDKFHQDDTSLHFEGKAINAEKVPGIVVPPSVCRKTKGIVLGSLCYVSNFNNGAIEPAVVFDIGPKDKIGEGTPELADRLGLPRSANSGGTSAMAIGFEILVGVPAVIDGIAYELQSYGG